MFMFPQTVSTFIFTVSFSLKFVHTSLKLFFNIFSTWEEQRLSVQTTKMGSTATSRVVLVAYFLAKY